MRGLVRWHFLMPYSQACSPLPSLFTCWPLCMLLLTDRHPAFGRKYRGRASMMIYVMCHTYQVSDIAVRSLSQLTFSDPQCKLFTCDNW